MIRRVEMMRELKLGLLLLLLVIGAAGCFQPSGLFDGRDYPFSGSGDPIAPPATGTPSPSTGLARGQEHN